MLVKIFTLRVIVKHLIYLWRFRSILQIFLLSKKKKYIYTPIHTYLHTHQHICIYTFRNVLKPQIDHCMSFILENKATVAVCLQVQQK